MRFILSALACLTLASPAASQTGAASPADVAIDRAVRTYASVRTARAVFEQSITNALTGSVLASKGQFEQSRPDKFAFRFSDPKGDLIISDGRFVWLYQPSSTPGQVIRAPLTADLEGSIDLIGAFFSNPRARYTISDGGSALISGHPTRLINLTPKTKDIAFQRARVWIGTDDGILRQFQATENSGITRLVRITTFEINPTVSPGAFTFTPPRGVRVVDSKEITGRASSP
ncbi:MAG: outer membrane lipoprotein chaperone LolA [Gemmatimonadota bacterium]